MQIFYRKGIFTVFCFIAVFLLVICFELAHIDKVIAQGKIQKVAICDPSTGNCAEVACYADVPQTQNKVCYLATENWIKRK